MKHIFSFSKNKEKKELSSAKRLFIGSSLIILSLFLIISFVSYFFTAEIDQSSLNNFTDKTISNSNSLGKIGATLSDFFIYRGFGLSSIIFPFLIFISALHILLDFKKRKLTNNWLWGFYLVFLFSIFFGLIDYGNIYSGIIGYEIVSFLNIYISQIGVTFLIIFMTLIYITFRLKVGTNDIVKVINFLKSLSFKKSEKNEPNEEINEEINNEEIVEEINNEEIVEEINNEEIVEKLDESTVDDKTLNDIEEKIIDDVGIEVEEIFEEKSESDNLSDKLVDDFGRFDPKLELSKFQFPKLNLLKQYDSEKITIDKDELEENKNRIVETLGNYNISISNIKATIGPTVTLYEIIPDAGVRISKGTVSAE